MKSLTNMLAADGGEMLVLLVALVLLVGVILLIWWAKEQAKKRLAALQAAAEALGLRFDPSQDAEHDERFKQFAIFQMGDSRRAYNTMRGTLDIGGSSRDVITGDFRYTVTSHNGKHTTRTTYHFSYLLVQLEHVVPELIIRRENFFDKIKAFLGFDDIDFESAEFSKRFSVKSTDKRFAWDLIDPRMIEWLLDTECPAIELEGAWMCLAQQSCWAPEDYAEKIALAGAFMDHWPEHTVRGIAEGRYGKGD